MIEHFPLNQFYDKLICWGAGDQARVINPIIQRLGEKIDLFIDHTPELESPIPGIPILQTDKAFESWLENEDPKSIGFIIAIGNPYGYVRCQLHDYLVRLGLNPVSIADPSAFICASAKIAAGAQIMCQALIHTEAIIGKQCIINTKAVCEHDDVLDNGVELAPASVLCGRVHLGFNTWVGANSVIIPRIEVGNNVVIAAGSSVIDHVPDNVLVAGVPAKIKKEIHLVK